MKILSAGWRMEYIESEEDKGCIFCHKAGQQDEKALIVKRGEQAYVIMNLYPYTTGHLMVAPYRHVGKISNLTSEEASEVMQLVAWCEKVLTRALNPDGFNIGMNIGRCAGAGFPDHVHVHVVPRWEGDTNFMPIVGETKVLPEVLTDTYRKIIASRRELEGESKSAG